MIRKWITAARRAWRSWTINWGGLLMLVGYFSDNIEQVLPFIRTLIPTEQVGVFVMVIGLVVVLLRIKTTQPLGADYKKKAGK